MTAAEAGTVDSRAAVRLIKVEALPRIVGVAGFSVRIKDGAVREAKVRTLEPPRFFEALLRGRSYADAPEMSARLCAMSSVSHVLAASAAVEMALGVEVADPALLLLRRLLGCGEWLRSHVLHGYFLHAPDFLGCEDAFGLSERHPGALERALRMKKLGNELLDLVGGRAVHPVNTRVGGFCRAPRRERLRQLIAPLTRAVEDAVDTVRLFAGLPFPDYEDDYTFVALHHPEEYAIGRGRIRSSRGLEIAVAEFEDRFDGEHIPPGERLLVGPLARYALNFAQLTPLCQELAGAAGLGPVVRNPFRSLVVRAIETLYACQEALRLVEAYQEPERAALEIVPRSGRGHGCVEAARGLCHHRYDLDEDGRILEARIESPTVRNQGVMEADLRGVAQAGLALSDERLKRRCEQAIRNHDPGVSGARALAN